MRPFEGEPTESALSNFIQGLYNKPSTDIPGPAVVVGPQKADMALLAPKIFDYLNKIPNLVSVRRAPWLSFLGHGGETGPANARGNAIDILLNPDVVSTARATADRLSRGAYPRAQVDHGLTDAMRIMNHEGIHAAYMAKQPELARDFLASGAANVSQGGAEALRAFTNTAGYGYPKGQYVNKLQSVADPSYFHYMMSQLPQGARSNPFQLGTSLSESIVDGMAQRAAKAEAGRWMKNQAPPYMGMFR